MRIPISFGTIFFITSLTSVCYVASNDVAKVINGTWVIIKDENQGGNQGIKIRNIIEERQMLSNKEISKKFDKRQAYIDNLKSQVSVLENGQINDKTALTERLATLNEEITTIETNQEYIKSSLEQKCQRLDYLLDPERHCCISDDKFHVTCISNFLTTQSGFEFPDDHYAGQCPSCPSGLQSR